MNENVNDAERGDLRLAPSPEEQLVELLDSSRSVWARTQCNGSPTTGHHGTTRIPMVACTTKGARNAMTGTPSVFMEE